jgi:Riboflavin kinase
MAFVAAAPLAARAARTLSRANQPRPAPGATCKRRRVAAAAGPPLGEAGHALISSVAGAEWLAAPVAVRGPVQRGLGRGSRKLGTPTANLPGALLAGVEETRRDGVYFGFGAVPGRSDGVVKMVANVGRNATFGDIEERVLEAYLMDDGLGEEFYGEEMRLCLAGFLRREVKFDGIGPLVANIRNDVAVARELLDTARAAPFASDISMFR